MVSLTEKEQLLYDFICKSIREVGYAPSVRDIVKALDWKSTSTVHAYLLRLEEKGLIMKASGKSRAMKPSSETEEVPLFGKSLKVPLLGRIAAGTPILAEENLEEYIDYASPDIHAAPDELFALRVKGESMIEAGIMDGDIIIIKKCDFAENGQIIAALIDNEATVKTFYKEKNHFRLQPENSTMEPIIVNELTILGKVVACMRYY